MELLSWLLTPQYATWVNAGQVIKLSLSDLFLGGKIIQSENSCPFERKRWPKPHTSICLDDLIPQVMFFHFNQFCGGPVFIEVRNTGIMCWGYSLSLSLRRPCLCNSTVSPRPRAVKHTLNHPCNPCSQQQTVAGRLLQSQFVFRLRLWWLDREK